MHTQAQRTPNTTYKTLPAALIILLQAQQIIYNDFYHLAISLFNHKKPPSPTLLNPLFCKDLLPTSSKAQRVIPQKSHRKFGHYDNYPYFCTRKQASIAS